MRTPLTETVPCFRDESNASLLAPVRPCRGQLIVIGEPQVWFRRGAPGDRCLEYSLILLMRTRREGQPCTRLRLVDSGELAHIGSNR